MNAYVQFMETRMTTFNNKTMQFEDCTPFEVECMGSAGVFILDGRNSIETMIEDAKQQVKRLHNIKPWITSFKIIKGSKFGQGTTLATVKVNGEQLPNGIRHTFERM